MRKLTLILILFVFTIASSGQQINYSIPGVTNKKITIDNTNHLDIGQKVTIVSVRSELNMMVYTLLAGESALTISKSDIKKITLIDPVTTFDVWQRVRLGSDLNESLVLKGYQFDLRRELEDETNNMLQNLEGSNGFFEDEFIEDYIQGLLYNIHHITLDDGRPGNLLVKILNSTQPYAFCTPSGTVVITTGLLSTIRSEDELIGILAHEIAHFVLDHQIVNINKAVQREKRAEFWTGVATTLAAASDVYLGSQYDNYPTGGLTVATAMLSSSIAKSIIERMGANYSIEQEWEADDAATKILTILDKDPKAFSAALSRIFYYCALNGDYLALSGGGTHPDLGARINKIGSVDPNKFNSTKYDQHISVINTYNAINEYSLKHIESTLNLTSRNIESEVATEDDYIIRAMAMRLSEKYQEALDLINKAKVLNIVPNSYIYKQEGLTLIRLGKPKEAVVPFENYLKALQEVKENSTYVMGEIEWTKKMIFKVGVL